MGCSTGADPATNFMTPWSVEKVGALGQNPEKKEWDKSGLLLISPTGCRTSRLVWIECRTDLG